MTPYYDQDGITIYHADCRDVLAQFRGGVAHVLTDPPYGRDVYLRAARCTAPTYSERELKRRGTALQKLGAGDIGDIEEMLEWVAKEIARLTARWAVIFSDVESCSRWRVAIELAGMRYVRTGVWVKPDAMPQMSGDRPSVGFEPCTIAHAQGPMRWNGGGKSALWIHNTVKGDERPDHPCPKPEGLMLELVAAFTDRGETILDPFMGTGTTLVAAKRLGRTAIGIELERKYCDIAIGRLSQGALFGAARW